MLNKILKFLSLGNKSNEQAPSNILEILNSNLDKKKNLNKLENWACNEYLNISDGFNEKKYKIVLLSFIFNSKNIYLESMPKLEYKIMETCSFLSKKQSDLGHLNKLFNENPGKIISHSDLQQYIDYQKEFYINSLGILTNVFNRNENLDICKKLYENFASLGLLGNFLTKHTILAKFLLTLQDDKLSEKDISILKNTASYLDEMISKVKEFNPSPMNYGVYNRIIINEDNPENLKVLLKFCNNNEKLEKMNNYNRNRDYLSIRDMLNTKIEYLEMKSELDQTTYASPSNNKKIKL